ncbi:uncharacterized protein LOC128275769 isoform X1 [Anopheles cruzii]|uniref:uncharacterized protein LOC128275769 isoform X1 n=1 Tax=Anopheles cruzii TaxID=68878 RepID=UPI0022EC5DC5|nr:uncharacterized protein LOC128275769 isoform X1 [Anopheles cruzii]
MLKHSAQSLLLILGASILCCLPRVSFVQCFPKVFRSNEICGAYNGHRVYFELGDRGQLQATNVTVAPYLPRTTGANQTTANVCTLELVTCPSCNFKISLSYSNFPTKCPVHNEPPCRCDYLEFIEPPFDETDFSGRRNCGHDVVYQTQTRSVMIKFVYWSNHSHAFTLDYVAERNRETIQANPGPPPNVTDIGSVQQHRVIATPHFPSYYPRDFGKEYVLSCNVEACRINVMFSDFQLAKTSTMDFYDWNGQRLCAVSGAIFRPPVVQSTGPSMIIRFYANGGSALGYRGQVSFLNVASSTDRSLHPNTNCGGVVENIGGAITMMKMVRAANESQIYDCVWLVKPPNTYSHLKTHLSLRVDTLEKLGPNSMLTIIQGTTSDGAVLSMVKPDGSASKRELIVPLTSGFYVHLRATFGSLSRLALVYSAFSYMDCYMGTEFLCQNRKCIPIQLHCDGFDHCGDNSDEPESCVQEWAAEPLDRRWYAHTPNYYFPKMDRYPDLRTATIIFIASSLGLIMLISALIVLLYRTGNRARQQRELHSQLQTISELLVSVIHTDSNATHGPEEMDDPPNYEAPPDYDEIIKIGMDDEMRRKRRRHSSSASGRQSRMRRSRRPSNASSDHPILEVELPPEGESTPTTSGYSRGMVLGLDEGDFEDSDAYERYSDAEPEDNNLRVVSNWNRMDRDDFFISSRILETPASSSGTGQSSGRGTGSSSPPPTYDQSNARFYASRTDTVLACPSISISGGGPRILAEDPIPNSLGVSFLPNIVAFAGTPGTTQPSTLVASSTVPSNNNQSVDRDNNSDNPEIVQPAVTTTASNMFPASIWSDPSQTNPAWQAFTGSLDEERSVQPVPTGTVAMATPNYIDLHQIQELDSYLIGFGHNASDDNELSSSQETINSDRTALTHLTASATTSFRSPCLCQSINRSFHQIQSGGTSSDAATANIAYNVLCRHCPVCRNHQRAQLHSNPSSIPGPGPAADHCSICNGRIVMSQAMQQMRQSTLLYSEQTLENDQQPSASSEPVKICTCFGRFPSQGSITRTTSATRTLLSTRTYSVDQLDSGRFSGANDRRSAPSSSGAVPKRNVQCTDVHRSAVNERRHEV